MDTFSFYLRASLWLVAGILLVRAIVLGSGMALLVFFFFVVVALAYTLFDNEYFGELVHYDALAPAPTVKEVEEEYLLIPRIQQTHYHTDTPMALVRLLERVRRDRTYVRIHYGDPDTGCAERVESGFINNSSGAVHIPLLAPEGDRGGVPLIDHLIVQVEDVLNGAVLYRHPTYQPLRQGIDTL